MSKSSFYADSGASPTATNAIENSVSGAAASATASASSATAAASSASQANANIAANQTAAAASEAARVVAVAAKVSAESARDTAITNASNSSTSATASNTSKVASQASEAAAATSQSASASSATSAATSATLATAKASAASISQASAATSASNAASSAAVSLPLSGGSLTGNLSLPVNGKVILGTSVNNSLQIFNDGSNSIITESSAGSLLLRGTNLSLQDASNNNYVQALSGGAVTLYDNSAGSPSPKISTTSSGASISGNIAVTGTVDGRDVATDGTKLDGIEASATADQTNAEIRTALEAASDSNVFTDADHTKLNGIAASANNYVLPSGYATETYVGTQITALVDSSPATLNTLNELAAALGDDPNFATTTANSIGTKLPLAGGSLSGNLDLPDNIKIRLGASQDLEISHESAGGGASIIKESGSGNLKIYGSNLELLSSTGEQYFNATQDGIVQIYCDNVARIKTSGTGASIVGNLVVSGTVDGRDVATDGSKLDGVEASADVTDTANVTSAGALMDSELTSIASVKALNQGVSTGNSPTFAALTSTGLNVTSNAPVVTFIESDQSNKQYQIGSYGASFAINDFSASQFRYIVDSNGNHLFNTGGLDCDFRVSSDGNTNMLFVDGGNNRVGVGTNSPSGLLTVSSDAGVANQYLNLVSTQSGSARSWSFGINSGAFRLFDLTANLERLSIATNGAATFSSSVTSTGLTVSGATALTHSGTTLSVDRTGGATALIELKQAGAVRSYLGGDSSKSFIVFNESAAERFSITSAGAATFSSTVTIGGNLLAEDIKAKGSGGLSLQTDEGTKRIIIEDDGDVVINETGTTSDFRVESNGNDNMLFVDGGNNRVGIGTNSPIDLDGNASPSLTISSNGPYICLQDANNSNKVAYIANNTGVMQFGVVADNGSSGKTEVLRISSNGAVFNENSADMDFRVKSDGNQNMLFVDGGANKVGIGDNPTDNASTLQVTADATASSDLQFVMRGDTDNNKKLIMGFDTTTNIASITSVQSGSAHKPLHLQGSEFVWNNAGSNHDFRVASDNNSHMLFVDASTNNVHMGSSANVEGGRVQVTSAKTLTADIPYGMLGVNDTTSYAQGVGGAINFTGMYHSNGALTSFGSVEGYKTFSTSGNYDGTLVFKARVHGGNQIDKLRLNATEAVFNEGGLDTDFRVASDNNSHMLFVDGGNDRASVGGISGIATKFAVLNGSATTPCLSLECTHTSGYGAVKFRNGNGEAGSISVFANSVTYNTSSDQRLKQNIADADDAGSKIDAIQVKQFDWKADGEHQDYGMIAQELQTVAPEAVSGDADSEEMMGVDYSKLVPMLIKEIQSLRQRVASLEE